MPVSRKWIESIWASYRADKCIGGWADFEWYAVDGSGHVGFFTSDGPGGVPEDILPDIESTFSLRTADAACSILLTAAAGFHEYLVILWHAQSTGAVALVDRERELWCWCEFGPTIAADFTE